MTHITIIGIYSLPYYAERILLNLANAEWWYKIESWT